MKKQVLLEHGGYYHIYNRGNNKENIFFEDRNYRYFLDLYVKYIVPVAETYAYCLLRNHFHILIRVREIGSKQASEVSDRPLKPTQQFSNLFNSYAKAINRAYERTGSLFQKHYGRILIDSERYLANLISYIHYNPQKHGFTDDFRTYPYSSYRAIRYQKPSRLEVKKARDLFGNAFSFDQYHTLANQALENLPYINREKLVGDDF